MSNALVTMSFRLNISEARIEKWMGRPDDGSQEWHEEAWGRVEEACKDDPSGLLADCSTDEPDVEVMM